MKNLDSISRPSIPVYRCVCPAASQTLVRPVYVVARSARSAIVRAIGTIPPCLQPVGWTARGEWRAERLHPEEAIGFPHLGGFLGLVRGQGIPRGDRPVPSTLFWHQPSGADYMETEGAAPAPVRPHEFAFELLGSTLEFAGAWAEALHYGSESDNFDLFPLNWEPILGNEMAVYGAQSTLAEAFPVDPGWDWAEFSPRESLVEENINGEGSGSGGKLSGYFRAPWEPERQSCRIDAETLAELDRLAGLGYWRAVDRLARAAMGAETAPLA